MSTIELPYPTLTSRRAMDFLEEILPDRFMEQMDRDPDDEWQHVLWTGSATKLGYIRVWNGERLQMMSRWILECYAGPPPSPKHQAGHICHDLQMGECPAELTQFDFHRLCCNPAHLAWQTAQANILASNHTRAHLLSNGLVKPSAAFRTRTERAWKEPNETNAMYATIL